MMYTIMCLDKELDRRCWKEWRLQAWRIVKCMIVTSAKMWRTVIEVVIMSGQSPRRRIYCGFYWPSVFARWEDSSDYVKFRRKTGCCLVHTTDDSIELFGFETTGYTIAQDTTHYSGRKGSACGYWVFVSLGSASRAGQIWTWKNYNKSQAFYFNMFL